MASNLPRPPTSKPGSSGVSTNRRTENVSYQSSRITRTMKLPQGAIKRLSVAMLLDQSVRWEGSGKNLRKVLVPPSAEAMKSVRDVVAAIVGLDEQRGDKITVETLPFEETLNQQAPDALAGTPPPGGKTTKWENWMQQPLLLPIALASGLVLIIGIAFLVIRSLIKKPSAGTAEMTKQLPSATASPVIPSGNATDLFAAQMAERAVEQQRADIAALAAIKIPLVKTKKTELLAKQVRDVTQKDPVPASQVLQNWIHERT